MQMAVPAAAGCGGPKSTEKPWLIPATPDLSQAPQAEGRRKGSRVGNEIPGNTSGGSWQS